MLIFQLASRNACDDGQVSSKPAHPETYHFEIVIGHNYLRIWTTLTAIPVLFSTQDQMMSADRSVLF